VIYKLEDITLNIVDGVHGDCEPQDDSGYYFISVKDMDGDHIHYSDARQITPESYREAHKRTCLESGDVLFANTGDTIGKMLLATPESVKLGQTTFQKSLALLKPNLNFVTVDYFYYVIMSNRLLLKKAAVGSGQKNLLLSDMRPFLVDIIDDKAKQEEVVRYVKAIDRKISLNNAINAELEKAAKLLYDYWFVQFDFPNAEGKPYRASGGKMVYNERLKRKIPKGWRVVPFSEVILENKQTLLDDVDKEGMFGLDLSIMPSNTMCLNQCGDANDFNSNRFKLSRYDLLFGSIRPYLKKAGFSAFDGVVNSTIMNFQCKDEQDYSFALCTLTSEGMFQYADTRSRGNGTRMPTINATELLDYSFAYSRETAKVFHKHFLPYWKVIANNINQNFELTALRDFLLPLLMNGQVTVAASEVAITEVKTSVVSVPAVSNAKARRSAVFKRLILSAYILDNICDEPTTGRVKFEKLLFLSEHCARLSLHSEFHRAAAGPYDAKALYAIESQLQKNQWFQRQKITGESRAYSRLPKADAYKRYIDANLNEHQKGIIDKLIRLLKTARTIQCEIIATLYGAWNDFIINGENPTDDQIVDEVLTNWHESKERIDRKRWFTALGWMRQNDIVPLGYGVSTKHTKLMIKSSCHGLR
jgi:type I restriction enzyme S subunit